MTFDRSRASLALLCRTLFTRVPPSHASFLLSDIRSLKMSSISALLSPLTSSFRTVSLDAVGERAVAMIPTLVRYRGGQSHTHAISTTIGRNASGVSPRKIGLIRCSSALTPALKTTLDKFVTSQKVILFMKGTKDFPQCGFSNTVVQILKSLNVPFETVNILDNDILRQGLKEYSRWPTFPQLYIDGEFFGGCDITVEAYKSGQLQELLEKAQCS